MARVPTARRRYQGRTEPAVNIPRGAFGEGVIGPAIQRAGGQIGQALSGAAATLERDRQRRDGLTVQTAEVEARNAITEELMRYRNLRGTSAVEGFAEHQARLAQIRARYGAVVEDPEIQQRLNNSLSQATNNARLRGQDWYNNQFRGAELGASNARLDQFGREYGQNLGNPEVTQQTASTIRSEVQRQAELQGWSREETEQQYRQQLGATMSSGILLHLEANPNSPAALQEAERQFQAGTAQGAFTSTQSRQIETQLQTYRRALIQNGGAQLYTPAPEGQTAPPPAQQQPPQVQQQAPPPAPAPQTPPGQTFGGYGPAGLVGHAEFYGNGATRTGESFNLFIGSRRAPNNVGLTQMTAREALRYADSVLVPRFNSSAMGAYQLMRFNVREAIQAGVLDLDTRMTPEVQYRIAEWRLLQGRGMGQFLRGEISAEQAANRLAMEYASLPVATDVQRNRRFGGGVVRRGQAYYGGFGLNRSRTPIRVNQVLEALQEARRRGDLSPILGPRPGSQGQTQPPPPTEQAPPPSPRANAEDAEVISDTPPPSPPATTEQAPPPAPQRQLNPVFSGASAGELAELERLEGQQRSGRYEAERDVIREQMEFRIANGQIESEQELNELRFQDGTPLVQTQVGLQLVNNLREEYRRNGRSERFVRRFLSPERGGRVTPSEASLEGAEEAYTRALDAIRSRTGQDATPEARLEMGLELAQRGVAPIQFLQQISEMSTSEDPMQRMAAAEALSRLVNGGHARSFGRRGTPREQRFADRLLDAGRMYSALRQGGYSEIEAIEAVFPGEAMREQQRRLREQKNAAGHTIEDVVNNITPQELIDIVSGEEFQSRDTMFWGEDYEIDSIEDFLGVESLGTTAGYAEIRQNYALFLETRFLQTGGNLDQARTMAQADLARTYGVTNMFGESQIQQHPIERVFHEEQMVLNGESNLYTAEDRNGSYSLLQEDIRRRLQDPINAYRRQWIDAQIAQRRRVDPSFDAASFRASVGGFMLVNAVPVVRNPNETVTEYRIQVQSTEGGPVLTIPGSVVFEAPPEAGAREGVTYIDPSETWSTVSQQFMELEGREQAQQERVTNMREERSRRRSGEGAGGPSEAELQQRREAAQRAEDREVEAEREEAYRRRLNEPPVAPPTPEPSGGSRRRRRRR